MGPRWPKIGPRGRHGAQDSRRLRERGEKLKTYKHLRKTYKHLRKPININKISPSWPSWGCSVSPTYPPFNCRCNSKRSSSSELIAVNRMLLLNLWPPLSICTNYYYPLAGEQNKMHSRVAGRASQVRMNRTEASRKSSQESRGGGFF